jgi:hypothetical protein
MKMLAKKGEGRNADTRYRMTDYNHNEGTIEALAITNNISI